jgi:hypothetical protein
LISICQHHIAVGRNRHRVPLHRFFDLANYLYAVLFDPSKHAKPGDPMRMDEVVFRDFSFGAPQFEISATGTLVYATGLLPKRSLVWVDKKGHAEPLPRGEAREYHELAAPKISPDGTKVALTVNNGQNSNIWILDLNRNSMNPLTDDKGENRSPLWDSNDRIIYFSSPDSVQMGINTIAADGSGKRKQLSPLQNFSAPFSLSQDRKALLLWELATPPQADIVELSLEGSFPRTPLLNDKRYDEQNPQLSPDGRWLAYASNKSNKLEVYLRPYPDAKSGGERPVSTGGGYGPLWSPDGKEIFYRNGDSVMVVKVETSPSLKLGPPDYVFTNPYFYGALLKTKFPLWDISRDGKRFLMMKEDTPPASLRKIIVVTNWFEALKQKAPVK